MCILAYCLLTLTAVLKENQTGSPLCARPESHCIVFHVMFDWCFSWPPRRPLGGQCGKACCELQEQKTTGCFSAQILVAACNQDTQGVFLVAPSCAVSRSVKFRQPCRIHSCLKLTYFFSPSFLVTPPSAVQLAWLRLGDFGALLYNQKLLSCDCPVWSASMCLLSHPPYRETVF